MEHDAWAITDEIYEHIRYAGDHHVLATWPGMRERTITISGLSKTFSCTGWRLGYAIAPPEPRRDPQGSRLPHGGRAGTAAGSRSGRHCVRRRVLQPHGRGLPRSAGKCCCDALTDAGFDFSCPRAHTTCSPTSRRSAKATTSRSRSGWRGNRRRHRAGIEFLCDDPAIGRTSIAVRVLQEARDAGGGRGTAGEDPVARLRGTTRISAPARLRRIFGIYFLTVSCRCLPTLKQ